MTLTLTGLGAAPLAPARSPQTTIPGPASETSVPLQQAGQIADTPSALPRTIAAILGTGQVAASAASSASDGTDAARSGAPDSGQSWSYTGPHLARAPSGPLRSFAEVPSELSREIQKARDALAQEGGGVQAMKSLVRQLSEVDTPSVSRTV